MQHYEKALEVTRAMLDAAQKSDWDQLVTLEKERGALVDSLRVMDGTMRASTATADSGPRMRPELEIPVSPAGSGPEVWTYAKIFGPISIIPCFHRRGTVCRATAGPQAER